MNSVDVWFNRSNCGTNNTLVKEDDIYDFAYLL